VEALETLETRKPKAMSIVRKNKKLALRRRFLWIVALLAEVANMNRALANGESQQKQNDRTRIGSANKMSN
jgi:hypothetical protein